MRGLNVSTFWDTAAGYAIKFTAIIGAIAAFCRYVPGGTIKALKHFVAFVRGADQFCRVTAPTLMTVPDKMEAMSCAIIAVREEVTKKAAVQEARAQAVEQKLTQHNKEIADRLGAQDAILARLDETNKKVRPMFPKDM
jgi:hypothetical protein